MVFSRALKFLCKLNVNLEIKNISEGLSHKVTHKYFLNAFDHTINHNHNSASLPHIASFAHKTNGHQFRTF